VAAPRTEGVQNPISDGFAADESKEIDALHRQFSQVFPNYTRDMAVEAFKKAKG
jgi:hypothetical protein